MNKSRTNSVHAYDRVYTYYIIYTYLMYGDLLHPCDQQLYIAFKNKKF